jgi:hypothetical protein
MRISRLAFSRVASLIIAAAFTRVAELRADTVSLVASADNTIYQGSNSRSNGAGDHFFAGRTDEDRLRRGLLRFDLTGIPAGSTITSATLTLHMSRTRAGAVNVSIHRVLAAWGEGTSNASEEEGEGGQASTGDATWSHRFYNSIIWTTAGGDFAAVSSASLSVNDENSFYSWSSPALSADVQGWLDNAESNNGWLLKGDESRSMTSKRFDSRENPVAAYRPELVVVFDPPAECEADFNSDGNVNSQDFFDFLAAFFAGDMAADFNQDLTVNSQDFFDFLAAFFAGC